MTEKRLPLPPTDFHRADTFSSKTSVLARVCTSGKPCTECTHTHRRTHTRIHAQQESNPFVPGHNRVEYIMPCTFRRYVLPTSIERRLGITRANVMRSHTRSVPPPAPHPLPPAPPSATRMHTSATRTRTQVQRHD